MSELDELFKKAKTYSGGGGSYKKPAFFGAYLPHLQKYYPLLKDKKVIDVGCFAGATSAAISEHAKSVIGLEPQKLYYDAALQYFGTVENCQFVNSTVLEFSKIYQNYDFDCFYASNILHQFDKESIECIEKIIFSKCDMCLLVSRENKLKDANGYGLNSYKNLKSFLEDNGFVVECFIDDENEVYEAKHIDKVYEAKHIKDIYIPVFGKRKK